VDKGKVAFYQEKEKCGEIRSFDIDFEKYVYFGK